MGKLRRIIVCRLCLQKCVDFKAIEACKKDLLDILLLKINLAVIEEPVMCTNCAATLSRCFDFKAMCIYTHDYIVPFLDDDKISKLDLRKVYMSKHGNVDIPVDHGVCTFCLGLAKKCKAVSLDSEGDLILGKLIAKCLPELDLSTVEEPTICVTCYESLKTCFHFVTSCLIAEEKILEYRKLTGAHVIELADLLHLTSGHVSKVEEDGNMFDFMSTERKFCLNMRNPEEQVGHNYGTFVHMEEQKLLLKEEVEIKTEQHDFDRSFTYTMSYRTRKVVAMAQNELNKKFESDSDYNPNTFSGYESSSCNISSGVPEDPSYIVENIQIYSPEVCTLPNEEDSFQKVVNQRGTPLSVISDVSEKSAVVYLKSDSNICKNTPPTKEDSDSKISTTVVFSPIADKDPAYYPSDLDSETSAAASTIQQHSENKTNNDIKVNSKIIRTPDFCFYCESEVQNFARHIQRNHSQEFEVQKIFTLAPKCIERKKGNV